MAEEVLTTAEDIIQIALPDLESVKGQVDPNRLVVLLDHGIRTLAECVGGFEETLKVNLRYNETVNDGTYALKRTVLQILWVQLVDPTETNEQDAWGTYLDSIDADDLGRLNSLQTHRSQPVYWSWFDGCIRIVPLPSSDYQNFILRLGVLAIPQPITSASQAVPVEPVLEPALVDYLIWRRGKDPTERALHGQLWREAVARAAERAATRDMGRA